MLPLSRDRVVFTRSDFCSPDEIFRCRLDGTDVQQLTALNRRRVEALQLGRVEDLTFAGAGGDPVQAWFLHPAGFDPHGKAKAPLAVVIHGGPQGAVLDSWHYRWNAQFLASHGFATLCVNFHGSTGFGQAFTDAINGDWGGKPFEDVMLGVDFALQRYPWLDRDRVGALGASYGGFLINWINGHTDRFKCLVNHDGLFNQEAMYFATEELFFPEFEFRGQPWNSELFRKFSPHCHVEKWKTPTLVIHGGKDFRVPETEGLSTFSALQRRGVPSAFLYFPDENHWVLNPSNSIVWHREVLAWLRRFLVV
jgi:dipeptidyl aminopeptidase/acylaminoacyl peptidase